MRLVRLAGALGSVVLLAAGSVRGALFRVNSDGSSIGAANLGAHRAVDAQQRLIAIPGLDSGIAAGPDGYLYWSDTTRNRIRAQLHYDRHGRLQIELTRNFITGALNPAVIAVYGGYLYWANDDAYGSIGRARLNGTDVQQNFVPSERASGGLDLNYPSGLAVTSTYIYWADSNQGSLARAATATGTGAERFIGGLSDPRGVAVHGDHLYWANDVDHGSIGRARLDGTGVERAFIRGAPGPCMVTVAGSHIYWADSG